MKITHTLMAVSLTLVLAVGCGKDGEGIAPAKPAISNIDEITGAADRRSLVGSRVDIPSAPAQAVVGNYVFWAGGANQAVPVVRMDKIKGPVKESVRKGDTVRMSGVVRLTSAVSATAPMWDKINDSERADINNAIVFIEADTIQISSRGLESLIAEQLGLDDTQEVPAHLLR